uniref:Uncharacterized protein n=1 Tax=Oryza brachyantha TaxID=4533 RepID=J3MT31_ORYBR
MVVGSCHLGVLYGLHQVIVSYMIISSDTSRSGTHVGTQQVNQWSQSQEQEHFKKGMHSYFLDFIFCFLDIITFDIAYSIEW